MKRSRIALEIIIVSILLISIYIGYTSCKHFLPAKKNVIKKGAFTIINDISNTIDTSLIYYQPNDEISLKGERKLSVNNYMLDCSYGILDNMETIGYYSMQTTMLGSKLLLQFEAWTEEPYGELIWKCAGNSGSVSLSDKKIFYCIPVNPQKKKIGDVVFQSEFGKQVYIKNIYLIDYDDRYSDAQILEGSYVLE